MDAGRAAPADGSDTTGRSVHVVLPGDIDDPAAPSGGNTYDRRVCAGLGEHGWPVREHPVSGAWPDPDPTDRTKLAEVLAALPDDAVVLLDGLIASTVPDLLAPHARRLRLVVLVHLPFDDEAEARALATARAVVTTSEWTRRHLVARHRTLADRVRAAPPGVRPAPPAPGSVTGRRLLCVAAVTHHKGYDVLVDALSTVVGLPWTMVCAGTLHREPDLVRRLRERLTGAGLTERVRFAGPLTGAALDAAYADADLLVLPSRGETYGMVVTEALARGLPVLTTEVGGLPEALGHTPDGDRPGLLVAADDPAALAGALTRWLTDDALRARLRRAALARRDTLTDWPVTTALLAAALEEVAG
ncbi:glycosyltransferase family 4 protein [Micromonospora sp. WMMD961]|uniref:glycosyltransferase family 4 protein n=1 Tax=Micromonospora sp. WMMD961 TaxID=3016100 RepID=UPI00241610F7|nr:glycosyltransferase family 4 protein [Micromonospora sp. WMMD961]MDG4781793.1 glycosyltransferase family 4 protein [Micromonospora sp. WMMD961]